jgi:hypothetical protein
VTVMLRGFSTVTQSLRKQKVTCEAGQKIDGRSHARAAIVAARRSRRRYKYKYLQ